MGGEVWEGIGTIIIKLYSLKMKGGLNYAKHSSQWNSD